MIAAQFELLKCGRELLSSPFRVSVHGGKEPVFLHLILPSELPRSSRFPPDRGLAPCENTAVVRSNAEGRCVGNGRLRPHVVSSKHDRSSAFSEM